MGRCLEHAHLACLCWHSSGARLRVLFLLRAADSGDAHDAVPSIWADADERFPETLAEQTSYADVIVRGVVERVDAGPQDGSWALRPRVITLAVQQVLKGSVAGSVTLAHSAWTADGT